MRRTWAINVVAILLTSVARPVSAQSAGQLGAWNSLMVSPFGALPPSVTSSNERFRRSTEVRLRYGRWKYDDDDVAHNNVGVTLARELPFGTTELALTGAYLSLQCGGCTDWIIAGLELESTFWRRTFSPGRIGHVTETIGLRSSVGGARNSGTEKSHAGSAALAAPIGLGIATGGSSYLDLAVLPGLGYGRISGIAGADGGVRPSIGAGLAWRLGSGFGIETGVQKVLIDGGPVQIGVGLSLGLGGRDRTPP